MFVITTLVPIIGCIALHYGIGDKINVTLGIINNEVASLDECFNRSLITSEIQNFDCVVNKLSCRFINDFESDVVAKVS